MRVFRRQSNDPLHTNANDGIYSMPYFLEQKPPASICTIMSDPRPVFEARPVLPGLY